MHNIEPQYFHQIKKGDTVMYGNQYYRVQDDGRGFLHIVVTKPQRKKIALKDIGLCVIEPGTLADYVLNNWFTFYTWEEFRTFMAAEIAWLNY